MQGGITMALNLDAIGKPIGPIKRNYSWKDAVLYALGIGAGFSELHYCFEKNLKVIPSFSVAMIFDFLSQAAVTSGVNLAGILHGEQELIFHRPIPPEGALITTGTIVDCYDKGRDKGALVVAQSETSDINGQKLFTSIMTIFGRLDGGFGGKDRKTSPVVFPDRAPDFTVEASPSVDQPLLYRLSGDIFHLHVDPEFAKSAGFDMPIMHGLCTHGFACRALIASLVPGRPELVRRLACRFSKALYPGIPIRTVIWKTGRGRAVWRTINTQTEEIVIDNGEFEYGDVPRDQIRFDGRVAIVTGAGAGLGRIYARELARRGAKVVVNDLGGARDGTGGGSSAPADRVVAEIRDAGGEAVANHDDVATIDGGANLVDTAIKAFGAVHIVINNAGILRDKSFVKMTAQNWQAVIDVHLKGAFNVTRPAFAVMKENGFGRIIMTTSAAGLYGNFGQSNYAAAKMGLVGLMNTLKLEGKKYDIKVNAVAPIAASRLTEDVMPPDLYQQSKPEFVSPLVLYLCSDRCSVSGHVYNAGMGLFSRVAMVTGPDHLLAQNDQIPSPESVMNSIETISSLAGGKIYPDLNAQVSHSLAVLSTPASAFADEESPASGFFTVAAVFDAMPGAFNRNAAAGIQAVFQYRISGSGGGDWYCAVQKEVCKVSAGIHDNPTCTLKMAEADFLNMINGQLLPMQAYTSGKLKIEGDTMKAQLIEQLFSFNVPIA
jgi:NAD(P)-dependent dehydrogenase (short-subunit alcohol dehydrogenase family)/acyl dehydratase/putative sterol carrier protein